MKSSFQSLIPFLPLFCNCQFRRFSSIQFLCSQTHILAGWRLQTRLIFQLSKLFFITTLHGPRRNQGIYCWEGVFTALFHSSRSYSIVACVFVATGLCLQIRCLAVNGYSDFTFPTFVHHVTVQILPYHNFGVFSFSLFLACSFFYGFMHLSSCCVLDLIVSLQKYIR
jgi:hypothetical protein